jgi:transcriptional regulator with XRE-family HTH domain
VAVTACVSDSTISQVERGQVQTLSLATLERIAQALEIRLELVGRWRGGDGDRLLNRGHSLLAASFAARLLAEPGWAVEPEISFSIFGERGVYDQLGWHAATGHLLVVEIKTQFADLNETLATLDRKTRLAPQVARQRGWQPRNLSVWLIVLDTPSNRRHAAEHAPLLKARFSCDGRQLRAVLRNPCESTRGLAFWSDSNVRGLVPAVGGGRVRVRPPRSS